MLGVSQAVVGREGVRQMEGHVLPVASNIDRYFNAIEQGNQVAIVPPGIPERMLSSNRAPEIVPWMGIVMKF